MKTTGKRILSALLFLTLLLGMIWLSAKLFVPKDNGKEDGIRDAALYGFLGEAPDTLEVLVVGDSLGQCSVSPMDLWREQGITAYNCCTGNQKLYESRNHLQLMLENQHPWVVLLEANTAYSVCPVSDIITDSVYQLFPVFRYHDRWKTLQQKDWLGKIEYTHTDIAKGYHISTEVCEASTRDIENHMAYTDAVKAISGTNVRYIKSIQKLCERNGIRLILFSAPSIECWNYRKHHGIAALAQELGLTYLDLNLMTQEVPIDWKLDTMDWGNHMNCTGAEKVTAYLGNYLKETGLFTDHRGTAAYSRWDDAVAAFNEAVADWVKPE